VQAFVMVLACSRHMFVRPVLTMDQHLAAISHAQRHHRLIKPSRHLPAAAVIRNHETTSHTGP
jgi:hypothetical protein